ncbi:MAG: hypothetical protein V1676_04865 [Candidatus Diapherotrites archaeon]
MPASGMERQPKIGAKSRGFPADSEAITRKRKPKQAAGRLQGQSGVIERVESSYGLPNETIRRLQNLLFKRERIPGGCVKKVRLLRRYFHIGQPGQGSHFSRLLPGTGVWVTNSKGRKTENYLGVMGKGNTHVAALRRKEPSGEWVKTGPKTFEIDEFSPTDNMAESYVTSQPGLYAWVAGIKVGPRWLGRLV